MSGVAGAMGPAAPGMGEGFPRVWDGGACPRLDLPMPPSPPSPDVLPGSASDGLDWGRWEVWGAALGVWGLVGLVRILSVVGGIRAQTCPLTEGMVVSFTAFDYGLRMLLTPAVFLMASRVRFDPGRRLRDLGWHAFAALALGGVHLTLLIATYVPYNQGRALRGADFPLGFKLLGSDQLAMSILAYAVTVTVALVLHHRRQQTLAATRAAMLETQLAQAELRALRMQLQPHFLFNTLHTIGALVDEEPAKARRMTSRLGDFLRMTLEAGQAPEISLAQELTFLRHYLDIEQIRFGSRLTVIEEVDPALLGVKVPNLILQPLVENALRHGLAAREQGGTLTLRAEQVAGNLRLQVVDSGCGLPANPTFGIGLSNVFRRLAQHFGAAGSLTLTPAPGGGTCASVVLPLRVEEVP